MIRANDESTKVIEAALPQEQETILAEMEAAGVTVTYPDKAPFIEATQSVRDELGTAIWGDEIYTQIVEIGGN